VSYLGILVGATFAWNVEQSAQMIVSILTPSSHSPPHTTSLFSSFSPSPHDPQHVTPESTRAFLCELLNRHIFRDEANVMGAVGTFLSSLLPT
jgi:hypothetical protein